MSNGPTEPAAVRVHNVNAGGCVSLRFGSSKRAAPKTVFGEVPKSERFFSTEVPDISAAPAPRFDVGVPQDTLLGIQYSPGRGPRLLNEAQTRDVLNRLATMPEAAIDNLCAFLSKNLKEEDTPRQQLATTFLMLADLMNLIDMKSLAMRGVKL